MTTATRSATDCAAWQELQWLAQRLRASSTRDLFAGDPQRFARFSHHAAGLLLDYSRQRIDAAVLDAFAALADQLQLRSRIESMFRGNTSTAPRIARCSIRRCGVPPAAP